MNGWFSGRGVWAHVHPGAALVLALAGCTEPHFEPFTDGGSDAEAGALQSPGHDAQVSVDAGVEPEAGGDASLAEAWWRPLARNYAISIRFFGRDSALGDGVRFAHEIIMRATTTVDAGGRVQMEAKRCRDHGKVFLPGIIDDFEWPYADRLAAQHFELVMRPEGIRTEAPPRPIGFVNQPTTCTPGARMSVSGRPWLSDGQCECRSEEFPIVAHDCRVVDADGDGVAGFTVEHRHITEGTEYARVLDQCQIEQGQLDARGRIRATYIENYEYRLLNCGDSACLKPQIVPCPSEFNVVLFEPLPDRTADGRAWECADVRAHVEAGKLFPTTPLTFPSGPGGC